MNRLRQQRAAHARDLVLAYLGATDATDVQLQSVVDRHITRVLDAADRNVSLAAKLLGVNRRTMQRYGQRKRRQSKAR